MCDFDIEDIDLVMFFSELCLDKFELFLRGFGFGFGNVECYS